MFELNYYSLNDNKNYNCSLRAEYHSICITNSNKFFILKIIIIIYYVNLFLLFLLFFLFSKIIIIFPFINIKINFSF